MNRMPLLAAAVLLAACATAPDRPDPAPDGRPPLVLAPHGFEVPRNPRPTILPDGLLVEEIAEDSPWARAGIRAGDVIERVNGREVRTEAEFREACGGSRPTRVRLVRSRVPPPVAILPIAPDPVPAGDDGVRLRIPMGPPGPPAAGGRLLELEVEA